MRLGVNDGIIEVFLEAVGAEIGKEQADLEAYDNLIERVTD